MPILEILRNKGLSNDDEDDEKDEDDDDKNGGAADGADEIDDGPTVLAHVELARTVRECIVLLFLFMIFT